MSDKRQRRKRRAVQTIRPADLYYYLWVQARDGRSRFSPKKAGAWFVRFGWAKRAPDPEIFRKKQAWLDSRAFLSMPDRERCQAEFGAHGYYVIELAELDDAQLRGDCYRFILNGRSIRTSPLPQEVLNELDPILAEQRLLHLADEADAADDDDDDVLGKPGTGRDDPDLGSLELRPAKG